MMRFVLITGTESTRFMLVEQLNELFSKEIHIISYSLETGIIQKIYNSIILVTSSSVREQALPFIDESCQVIKARRTLDFSKLDKLYPLKKDSQVLLVNDTYGSAVEVADILIQAGFSNFHFTPYYPHSKLRSYDFDYIITPGEEALCPSGLAPIIDIGTRVLDITTITELLHALSLLDDRAHFVSAKYVNKIISQGMELHDYAQSIKNINEFLFTVINSVDDGIFSYSQSGSVTTCNTNAERIAGIKRNETLGASPLITKAMADFFFSDKVPNSMFSIDNIEYLFSKIFVEATHSYVCTIKNARERINLENRLRKELKKQGYYAKHSFDTIVHQSSAISLTIERGKKLSRSDYNILILGESGTGKELFASAIHNHSPRHNGPYLAVNFSALPEELIESELFGYEEGAFTGAKKGGKIGLFEIANGGTIFLDEIGDIPPKIQLRLLRVLQEKEIMKVGGSTIIPVDVRVIAATNKNLFDQVEKSLFREDLYYRLKKLYLNLPPLRERKEDILALFRHFLQSKSDINMKISPDAEKILLNYNWPGNVRELENTVEYILAICDEDVIMPYHLPEDIGERRVNHLPLDDIELFLLQSIGKYNQRRESIGRKKLSELSFAQGYNLSEQQIRTRLDKLSAKGFLRKNRGKLGLELTAKGKENS